MSMHYPFLFHTQASGAAGLAMALHPADSQLSRSLAISRYSHASSAARLVSNEIRDLNGAPSDALIMAVLNLGVYAGEVDKIDDQECHPPSPLATVQNLHAFGRLTLIPSHARALHALVEKAGGLQAVGSEIRGLEELVQL